MIRAIFVWCCLLLFNVTGLAQKGPTDYFEEGAKYVESKEYTKAVAAYQYIVDHHRKNEIYPESFYNLAYTYYLLEDYRNAITLFKTILKSDFDEMKLIGGDIVSSPYANFRHRASSLLSDLYYEQKQYDSSLYYLALSDSVYQYQHFCGNAYASYDIYLALRYSDIYLKLKQKDKAVASLLKAVFIELEDNTEVIKKLKVLLKGQEKGKLQQELNKAISEMYAKTLKEGGTSNRQYYIRFLGTEILVPFSVDDEYDKEKVTARLKESFFYDMVVSL